MSTIAQLVGSRGLFIGWVLLPFAWPVYWVLTNDPTFFAAPADALLDVTGNAALACLAVVLLMTPLRRLWPRQKWSSAFNRHRRFIGVSAFAWASAHFLIFVLATGVEGIFRELDKPFIVTGIIGWIILSVLALTSFAPWIRWLGRNWKRLHRWVYLAAVLLVYHAVVQEKTGWPPTLPLILVLGGFQIARWTRPLWFRPNH